ncbi:MAG: hypothetical protein CBC13_07225 [Planctomycetia bacterium TMED53]|nr:MAG: hypothetical protein CBC13_07225 [Planctomycetia bacterium TMED53]
MNEELTFLIKRTLAAKKPGYFHLGKGRDCRRIAFTGSDLIRIDNSQFRWFPTEENLNSKLSPQTKDGLMESWVAGDRDPLTWISTFHELSDEEKKQIGRNIDEDEIINTFFYCLDGFLFERNEEAASAEGNSLPSEMVLQQYQTIQSTVAKSKRTLPCLDELLVLSGIEITNGEKPNNWAKAQVLNLVDGFRTLDEILEESPFPPHVVWNFLHESLLEGLLLKQRFPEFSAIHPGSLNPADRKKFCQRLEAAIPVASSPTGLLEMVAEIHRLDNNFDALISTGLRIVDSHRIKRNIEAAIETLDTYIDLAPDPERLHDLRQKMMTDHANDLLNQGDLDRARRWLREAIDSTDDDQLRLALIGSYKDASMQIREGARIATKLYRSGQSRRALRLLDSLEALHPENEEMQQIRVEFLIDHGEVEASEEALTRMAARLAREGRLKRARKVANSVAKIRTRKKSKALRWITPFIQNLPRLIALVFFATLISLIVISEAKLQKLIVSAAAIPPAEWREQARPWLLLVPEGPWKHGLNTAAELVDERERDIQQDFATKAKSLLSSAKRNRRLGYHQKSKEKLALAEQHGAIDEVRELRSLWEIADKNARALRQQADKARSAGDLEKCHQLLRTLIERFPSNDATSRAMFPVEITSEKGTTLHFEGEPYSLPAIIDLHPFKPIQIELEKEGRKTLYVLTADGPPRRKLPAPK